MVAEGVGFEPTVGFPTLDFESSALNRTQPPFLQERRKLRTTNVQHRILNATVFEIGRSALGVERCIQPIARLAPTRLLDRILCLTRAKNVTILRLPCPPNLLHLVCPHGTATLLLVVDQYSQVLGAAVHQYCQLIRTSTPLIPP